MTLVSIAILLLVAAAALCILEILLPAHGVIGGIGAAALVAGVAVCFYLNQWLGLLMAAGLVVATPFAINIWMKLWPKSPIGRRLFLPHTPSTMPPSLVSLGQAGVTVSELRPMGLGEFGGTRVEVRSEFGMIPPGHSVRIVAFDNGRPVVRAM